MNNITGTVEHITFHNPDTGFCVLHVIDATTKEKICVVGQTLAVSVGEKCTVSGQWVENKTYGKQLKAHKIDLKAPSTLDGMRRYLAGGAIDGIGPQFAWRIVKQFGEATFDILDNEPHRLAEVQGIGKGKLTKICSSWEQHSVRRDAMVFLQSHHIGPARAATIYKAYGAQTIATIRENPYRLYSEIRGIGFKIADSIAVSMGIEKNSLVRAKAGLLHTLEEHTLNGHCAAPQPILIESARQLLDIETDRLEQALKELLKNNAVVCQEIQNEQWIYPYGLFYGELGTSQMLKMLAEGEHPVGIIDTDKAVTWVQKETGIPLAPSQKEAIIKGLTAKLFVITGGPGVGKTTLVNSIVSILEAKELRVSLAAPTGRAAKRLGESTGRKSKTIHRLLEYEPSKGGFAKGFDSPLATDVVVIDEVSMVDVNLMYFLLRAIPSHAAVILVGDVDQLPSVGPGSILKDIIDSQVVPVSHLTEIFRQDAESLIITNAHRINAGTMPVSTNEEGSDFYFIECNEPTQLSDTLVTVVSERLPKRFAFNPLRDIQVLTPMNHTPIGAIALNNALQKKLNPRQNPIVSNEQRAFYVDDKVMQIQNNYDKDVFNGDIGFITHHFAEDKKIAISFDGRTVEYAYNELDQITLAYACTIHKSQGSEYPAVVIPLHTQHFVMLQRNLIYTAITRGRNMVVLIGTKKALEIAVQNGDAQKRFCALRYRLTGEVADPIPEPLLQG